MSKHLSSKWRDPRISIYKLSDLTPMDLHKDERWRWRDLPSIESDGLWYPLMLYKITPEWWHGPFSKWRPLGNYYIDPVINDDGMIWAVKMGSNRWQVAKHLGYDTIDAMMFDHSDDCVKMARWHKQCDPLHNPDRPYTGAWSYE